MAEPAGHRRAVTDAAVQPAIAFDVAWRDISAYREGTGGIDYVFSFDGARPGPHLVVNALTHGNEFCGREVVTTLLDHGLRPQRGRLSLVLANVAAHDAFDPADPGASRFVDRDFNRIWDDRTIDEDTRSSEAARARQLRPLYRTADRLLDLHTTFLGDRPFFVIPDLDKAIDLARKVGSPGAVVVLAPGGMHGRTIMEYGPFVDPGSDNRAVVVECGQHWARAATDRALDCTLSFLVAEGALPEEAVAALRPAVPPDPQRHYQVTAHLFAETDRFRYARGFSGFDVLAPDEVVAWDGDRAVRAPHDDAVVILARPRPKRGGEAMSFGRLVS